MKLHTFLPPPLIALCCAALIWYSQHFGAGFVFPPVVTTAFISLLIMMALILDCYSFSLFYQKHTTISPFTPHKTEKLVTTGVYRFTRNPMYLSLVLWLCALGFYRQTLLFPLPIALFVIYINHFQITYEEEALSQLFGQHYSQYTSKVRRWI